MVRLCRFPSKDQQGITGLLEERLNGVISEEEWTDIVIYLYNGTDSRTLNALLRDIAMGHRAEDSTSEVSVSSSGVSRLGVSSPIGKYRISSGSNENRTPGSRLKEQKEAEMKKYGYLRSNPKLKKDTPKKLSIAYCDFSECILNFQLKNHEKFLERFVSAFRQVDINLDGILNPEEFHDLFMDIRFDGVKVSHVPSEQRDEAEETFSTLLNIVDPNAHHRISFSAAASCLSRLGGSCRKKA